MPELPLRPSKTNGTPPPMGEGTGAERRGERRYPFTASAELFDQRTGACLHARTSDISLSGCYIDTTSPLTSGTQVKVRLTHGSRTFATMSDVSYAQPTMGMGLAFTEIPPDQSVLLQRWLAELSGTLAPALEATELANTIQRFPRMERYILARLVSLLIRKGTLTEPEGAELLRELIG